MMKAIPVRADDRPVRNVPVSPSLTAGVLFWMSLVALAVISFAL